MASGTAATSQFQLAGADTLAIKPPAIAPENFTESMRDFNWDEVISKLVDVGVSLGLRLVAALLVFVVGRFIILRVHKLLRAIMIARSMDRSLSTFLLSFFKITFFFVLTIIVISILGIETSSFIALFASAGIAIGMAFSGTLQNFAGGVLILLLKPYKVGEFIEFEQFKGTVKEIQIFHTVILTYNNESIIIPNGGLSTGTINNYSREKYRRLEWRVSVAYGSDVDKARNVIVSILENDDRILKPGTENDNIDANNPDKDAGEHLDEVKIKKLPWYKRFFYKQKKRHEQLKEWREEKQQEIESKMPIIDFTPYVALENLDDSAVVLVARAWCDFANYWSVLYAINEQVYKQLPENGVEFPFPQLDVHINNN